MQVQKVRLMLVALVVAAGIAGVIGAGTATAQAEAAPVVATGDGGGSDDTPWD